MPWYIFSVIFLLFIACSQTPSPSTTTRTPSVHLVKTAIVNPQPYRFAAVYTGSLRARRFVRIFMQEEGRITYFPYYEGDSVKANALLVQLDDTLLNAELDKAIATHKYARLNVRRLKKLAKQHIVSIDELSRAQTELEIARVEELILRTRSSYTKITAPFAGIVTARLAEPGDVINANTHILSIIVPSSLVIDVNIPERLLSQLKRLDPTSIQIDALGTQTYKGYISRIHPTIDSRTRFGRIEITLRTLPRGAQEGQFCRVTLTRHISPQLTLPYSALRRDREGEYVFLVDANNKTQRQEVRSGRRLANRVEILDGLKKYEVVVIKGFLGLQDRKKVQLVE
jgi:RND family efflux transporter MFP subunit